MIRIFTDGAASFPRSYVEDGIVRVFPITINWNGKDYDAGTMDVDSFYNEIALMRKNPPSSSQPSPALIEDAFEEAAVAGDSVFGVFISLGMSGTFESVVRAARAVAARHVDFRYTLVDSTSNSADEGMPLVDGIEAILAGKSLEEAAQDVLNGIRSTRFTFAPESLDFLRAGGRIGAAVALLGNLIKLTPVLTVRNGVTDTLAKVRTVRKAYQTMVDQLKADIEQSGGLKRIVVHYIGAREPAVAWAREVIDPIVGKIVDVVPVSPCVGVHVGPALSLCYECNAPLPNKYNRDMSHLLCTH